MNPTPPTTLPPPVKFIDLIKNTSHLFNNPLPHHAIKLHRMKIFKIGFRKLSILSKFWEWCILQGVGWSSCLRHYDTLQTKIGMWLVPKGKMFLLCRFSYADFLQALQAGFTCFLFLADFVRNYFFPTMRDMTQTLKKPSSLQDKWAC